MNSPSQPSATDFVTRLARLGWRAEEITESFARSSGPGGQHVNKVSTAVTLRHGPSGVAVTVQDSRSQAMNRQLARERLLAALEEVRREEKAAQQAAREKIRRQNRPRPRGVKRRILESKKKRGAVKKLRGRVE
ncbi:MAG: peptide chain release factor-like protein [Verrucomicrobia bacterium]|nr:peptide chain release factor-like protein [Verrucomicrobiota bacterium]